MKKTVRDVDLEERRVLVRVDFNVPLEKGSGKVADDTRIRASLPTVQYLLDKGAKVILCSHLGRPEGRVVEGLRLAPVAARLAQLLGRPVQYVRDCVGEEVRVAAGTLSSGQVLLLENLRFHPEEEANDPSFARELAELADLYVNDAFGTAHRAHASTVGVAHHLPSVAGLLMEKEIASLSKVLSDPERPFAALIGGAKVSDKIVVLENLMERVDALLIGGGMACTFLAAQGYAMGQSLVEEDRLELARSLFAEAQGRGLRLLLPVDAVVANGLAADAAHRIVPISEVPQTWRMLDIGPQTVERFAEELKGCKTVLWNGPMGVFELPPFAEGTRAMAALLAELEATTVVGGGETAEAVAKLGYAHKMTHVSTGGGASLEFLEGRVLPGIAVLQDDSHP